MGFSKLLFDIVDQGKSAMHSTNLFVRWPHSILSNADNSECLPFCQIAVHRSFVKLKILSILVKDTKFREFLHNELLPVPSMAYRRPCQGTYKLNFISRKYKCGST